MCLNEQLTMKKIYKILGFLFLIGCTTSNHNDLASNPTIKEIFNETEIKDLVKILEFFDHHLCQLDNTNSFELDDCYHKFLIKNLKELDKDRKSVV